MTRRSPWLGLVLALSVIAVVVLVDRVVAPDPPSPSDPVAAPAAIAPAAGSWVCAVGDGTEDTTLDALVARPAGAAGGPAEIALDVLREGEIASSDLPALFPPSHAAETVDAEGADDAAVHVRWQGAPVATHREWRWEGNEDLPDATVAGPCAAPSSPQWVVPGLTSAGGHEARLRLVNVYRTDATVAISFLTPEGERAPIALQNWTVPAGSAREIDINEVLPEEDDLAAVVDVMTGRLSVEGYQITRSVIGGVDGGSLLAAASAPSEMWTVPWIADDDVRSSWLWVANTGDRTAPVELTVHTPDGGDVPDGLAELSVPPGELRRVDLSGTLPDDDAAVTVRSDGVPVVVSGAVRVAPPQDDDEELPGLDTDDPGTDDPDADDPDPTTEEPDPDADAVDGDEAGDDEADEGDAEETASGFAVQLGVTALDSRWTVSGLARNGRTETLRLVNPSGEDAVIDVELFQGTSLQQPDALQSIELPAGTSRSLELTDHLPGNGAWTAFVTASEGQLAVGRLGWSTGDQLHLVAVPGVPAAAALPSGPLLVGVETEGLVRRLGTSLGLFDTDPFDVTDQDDAPIVPGDDDGGPQPDSGDVDAEEPGEG